MERTIIKSENFNAYFGNNHVVKNVNIEIERNKVIAVMGPSGCGKTTYLRCINRLHELIEGAKCDGKMLLNGQDVYSMHPIFTRLKIGMVFQKPNPFPSMSIFENVASGLKLNHLAKGAELHDRVVSALQEAALWTEVKDKLNASGMSLSGGQQQRLCIARALAVKPPVLLMDEPTSALDPISTAKIEELVIQLKQETTLLMVTHNMQQAARISDKTAFFLYGNLVEYGVTTDVFTTPRDRKTEEYITGRFG